MPGIPDKTLPGAADWPGLAPITLLTDFGQTDTYVGQMRGVIAGIAPGCAVIDLTHAIAAQQILQGALVLADAVMAFPAGTIHMAVIDPGVGTARRPLAARIGPWGFVGPDNGVFSVVLERFPLHQAVVLDRPEWWRPAPAATFHGRDLFAPVAAHWHLGTPLEQLGSPIDRPLVTLSVPRAARVAGELRGEVVWIDHFGNLVTSITQADLAALMSEQSASLVEEVISADGLSKPFRVWLGALDFGPVQRTYGAQSPGTRVALIGSSGRLELAVVNGSAADSTGAKVGASVHVGIRPRP